MPARKAIAILGLVFVLARASGQEMLPPPKEGGDLLPMLAHTSYHTVAYSPDGSRLSAGGRDYTLKVWDAATGSEVQSLRHTKSEIIDVAFSPNGKWVAGSSREGAMVWDLATGKEVFAIRGRNWISRVAFSPDSKQLAAAGPSYDVTLWDVPTGQQTGGFPRAHKGNMTCVCYSGNAALLASSSADKTIQVWDLRNSRPLFLISQHTNGVHTIAFSPDGKRLASASLDKTVKLWDSTTGAALLTLTGHANGVNAVAFSPDGRRVASGSVDRTVKVWDLRTAQEVATFHGHASQVFAVAFSPDGKHVASTASDGLVRVWNLAPVEPVALALSPAEVEALWVDLNGNDAARVFRAIMTLAVIPETTVPLLQGRVKPAAGNPEAVRRLAVLIAHLDDNRFEIRQDATRELERLGRSAEPALLGALEGRPSLEVRLRIEQLLESMRATPPSPEQVHAERIVELVERIGTAAAREILRTLAGGSPNAWLTREARAGLERRESLLKPPVAGRIPGS